jgi:hypothetical protein
VTIGIEKATACIFDTNPKTYPGIAWPDVRFEIVAPTRAGTYPLRTGHAWQLSCANALKLDSALDDTVIATIVVE